MKDFKQFRSDYAPVVEKEMSDFLEKHTAVSYLKEGMLYSVQAGGKRLRPLLLLASIHSFGRNIEKKDIQIAAALEMIHTYSLIHDDLPAMDDDDLRRGKPTNHKIYGEAHAILAGDGLLTAAFQLTALSQVSAIEKVLLLQLLAKASGAEGMVAGQTGDLLGEEQPLDLAQLVAVHERKTGALIEFALLAGGILAEQPEEVVAMLGEFAKSLGLAFQIRDDLLDVTSSEAALGKQIGRDAALNKSTYPGLLGLEGAKQAFQNQMAEASDKLTQIEQLSSDFTAAMLREILKELELEEKRKL